MIQRRQIDLLKGWPAPSLLPPKLLNAAAGNILSASQSETSVILEYGAEEGYQPLRDAIARWLTAFYVPKQRIPSRRIAITGGASQNLACILQTFTDPLYTRNVFMVAPTYYLACRIITDSGFDGKLKAVPEDEEGIDLDFLREALRKSEAKARSEGNTKPTIKAPKPWRYIYKHIIYCVPTFSNPTGKIMSLRRREELVRLAREYDALVITDDVYDMLQWPSSPDCPPKTMDKAILPRIVDIDRYLEGGPTEFGNACSNGSFSKLVGPGCRTGWLEGTEAMAYGLSQTGSTRSGGAPSQLVAAFIYDMMAKSILDNHIYRGLQPAYARRYHRLLKAVQGELIPLGLVMPQPNKDVSGGYFLWLTLPGDMCAEHLCERALQEEDLIIMPGMLFRVEGDESNPETQFTSSIRLCYAYEDEELLTEGVSRLAQVIKRHTRH